jgi:hypothetical protein
MAFKKLNRGRGAPAISPDAKHKVIMGYLLAVQSKVGKFKKSRIFELQQRDGSKVNVWGSTQINGELLDETGREIEPALVGKMVRLTFKGKQKVKGRKESMHLVDVEVDLSDSVKAGKAYPLNREKKFKK